MKQTVTTTFIAVECATCGCMFGVSKTLDEHRQSDHLDFYCPNGHRLAYQGKSREEKLKKQLDDTSAALARSQSAFATLKREKAAVKGQLTKTKKRVANGVCPCCNRTFQNLGRHMHGQHPEYAEATP